MCISCLSWYQRNLAPYVVHAACSSMPFRQMRKRMLPHAEGVVVEVGCGSGLNLPYYEPSKIQRLIGVDPEASTLAMAEARSSRLPFEVQLIRGFGENLPVDDRSADTVVVTYALCTIPEPTAALQEIRRILKPTGRLVFAEHGQSGEPRCRRWQDRLNRAWQWAAAGCHLDRDPVSMIEQSGFRLLADERSRFPLAFWQLGTHYAGIATVA